MATTVARPGVARSWCSHSLMPLEHRGVPAAVAGELLQPTRAAMLIWTRWPSLTKPDSRNLRRAPVGAELGLARRPPPTAPSASDRRPVARSVHPVVVRRIVTDPTRSATRTARPAGYDFVRVALPTVPPPSRHREPGCGNASSKPQVERVLQRVRWRDLRLTARSTPAPWSGRPTSSRGRYALQSDSELIVYVSEPRPAPV